MFDGLVTDIYSVSLFVRSVILSQIEVVDQRSDRRGEEDEETPCQNLKVMSFQSCTAAILTTPVKIYNRHT